MIVLLLFNYLLPQDSPLCENIEYLQIRGLISASILRPYDWNELLPQFDALVAGDQLFNRTDARCISSFNRLLTKQTDFSTVLQAGSAYDNDSGYRFALDSRIGGQLISNWKWNQGIRIRYARDIDSLGPRPWKDHIQAFLNEGNILMDHEKMMLLIGRRNYLFTPGGESSLLLSPAKEGFDGYFIKIPAKYFDFQTIFLILDADVMRFIALHRIGLNLKTITLGFSEAILFSDNLEPIYLNFFLPYYFEQWGIDRDDNIMWQFDLTVNYFNTILYGELLVDDYMYEDDPYPSKLAYQVGFKNLSLNSMMVKLNYVFVDKWVYTHRVKTNVYENRGYPLGYPLGNDCDRLSVELRYFSPWRIDPKFLMSYARQGQGSIYLPYEEEGGPWNPPFPSGVVEKTVELGLGFDYSIAEQFFASGKIGRKLFTNKDHVPASDPDETSIDMRVWMIF